MSFTKEIPKRDRPGIYIRIENIGKNAGGVGGGDGGGGGPGPPEITAIYYPDTKTLSITADGIVVTYDGICTVSVVGLPFTYNDGTVKLGG